MGKILSVAHFSLASIIIHCIRDIVSTKKANCIFGYSLLLTDIFRHFDVDLLGEQRENTDASNIILSLTISRSFFEYDEEKRNG